MVLGVETVGMIRALGMTPISILTGLEDHQQMMPPTIRLEVVGVEEVGDQEVVPQVAPLMDPPMVQGEGEAALLVHQMEEMAPQEVAMVPPILHTEEEEVEEEEATPLEVGETLRNLVIQMKKTHKMGVMSTDSSLTEHSCMTTHPTETYGWWKCSWEHTSRPCQKSPS